MSRPPSDPARESSDALVGIVVVNWNGAEDTVACVHSLSNSTFPNFQVIVVDNGSAESDLNRLRDSTDVTLIALGENVGVTRGNNVGIREALATGCTHVLLLNNDTVVDAKMLELLVETIESAPEIGIAGPRMYYFDPPGVIWFDGGAIDFWRGDGRHSGLGQTEAGDGRVRDVDYVTSCAMLVKRGVFDEIGEMDDAYFIYFDETDFCVRARRAGWRAVLRPDAHLWHKVSASMGSGSARYWFHYARSRSIFLRKHASRLQKTVAFAYLAGVDLPWKTAHFLRRRKPGCIPAYLRGTLQGLRYPLSAPRATRAQQSSTT